LQKAELAFAGQTTIREMLSVSGPIRTVEDVGVGFEHDGKASGAPCWAFALEVSQGLNAGTNDTSSGEAPIGRG
jgi:hypothetical protein